MWTPQITIDLLAHIERLAYSGVSSYVARILDINQGVALGDQENGD